MQIREAARRLDISTRAIRYYEEQGLLSPAKSVSTRYRQFDEHDLWRLQTIVALREAGMAVQDIRRALDDVTERGQSALLRYLELQQSVMTAQWLGMRTMLETTEKMIELLRSNRVMPPEQLYELAERSRSLRKQRSMWQDRWNFDERAASHDTLVATDPEQYPEYERTLDSIVQRIAPLPGEYGLDIGTGTGNLAGRFMAQGARVAGVDQSDEMLRICSAKLPAMETRIGNILAIPYLDGRFDYVVSAYAFRHLSSEQQWLALAEMRRVLKPGGRLCIADTQLDGLIDAFPHNTAELETIGNKLQILYACFP